MDKKRIYIADIHMNAGRGFRVSHRGSSYEWLGPEEAERFAKFLDYLNDPDAVEEVIILGDLMDNWVYPHDEVPPSLQDILDARINKKIVRALKRLAKRIKVVYLPGNHDMGVTAELVAANFRGMVFGGRTTYGSVYRTSRLRAEHGSAHAMFNAPDSINGSVRKLPLGYYISRVVATKARNTGDARRHYWLYADDLLETFGPQRLAASVFEAVLEEAGLDETTEIKMPKTNDKPESVTAKRIKKKKTKAKSSTPGRSGHQDEDYFAVTAAEIKQRYACLYDQWKEIHGMGSAFKAIMAETGLLNRTADHLCRQRDTNIVVFGHSHSWKLDKDTLLVDDRIYANCGTWCDRKQPCTWVESRKDRDLRRHFIRVMDWNNAEPKELKSADVPL